MGEGKVGRRRYLKYLGTLAGGLVIGALTRYLIPGEKERIVTTLTETVGGQTVTETATRTLPVTETVTRTLPVTTTATKTITGTVALEPTLEERAIKALSGYEISDNAIVSHAADYPEVTEDWLDSPHNLAYAVKLYDISPSLYVSLYSAVKKDMALFEPVIKVPESIDDYSWDDYSVEYIRRLSNRIPHHGLEGISTTVKGIEQKPDLGIDLIDLTSEGLTCIFEDFGYDQILENWVGIRGLLTRTRNVFQGRPPFNFYQDGALIARELIDEVLKYQFGNEKAVLSMDERLIDTYGDRAYKIIGDILVSPALVGLNETERTKETNAEPGTLWHDYSLDTGMHNVKEVWPKVSGDLLEASQELLNELKYLYALDIDWFPNSVRASQIGFDVLRDSYPEGKILNFVAKIEVEMARRIGYTHKEWLKTVPYELLVALAPIYGGALRIPVYPMVGSNPGEKRWHGEMGFSITKETEAKLRQALSKHGTLLMDRTTRAICPMWLVKEYVDEDGMTGGVKIGEGNIHRVVYKP